MNLADYTPILVLFVIVIAIGGLLMFIGAVAGPKRPSATKLAAFECGSDPVGNARHRFSVKFYLLALLFIAFDIEGVFLYPWAVVFKDFIASGHGLFMVAEMFVFLGLLFVGLIYVWRKDALEWDQ